MDTKRTPLIVFLAALALLLTFRWTPAGSLQAAARTGHVSAARSEPRQETVPAEPTSSGEDPTPVETVPPVSDLLQITLDAGPERLCPGWNIYYTLRITNTHSTEALAGVVVTANMPSGTWYDDGGLGGKMEGAYDALQDLFIWQTGTIPPGTSTDARLTLHSFSSLASGRVVSSTFSLTTDGLSSPISLVAVCTVDQTVCGPTSTPTPSSSATSQPTATVMPTRKPNRPLYIPLVLHGVRSSHRLYMPLAWKG